MEKQAYNRIKAVLAENRRTNNWLAEAKHESYNSFKMV